MKTLIVGGTSGLGLGFANYLVKNFKKSAGDIIILGRNFKEVPDEFQNRIKCDLRYLDRKSKLPYSDELDELIITVGNGRLELFENLTPEEVEMNIRINFSVVAQILSHYRDAISCGGMKTLVISSIASKLPSPFYSIYSAAKCGLDQLITNINHELVLRNAAGRICVANPGHIEGTKFDGGDHTDLERISQVVSYIYKRFEHEAIINIPQSIIPNYGVYKDVINRARIDPIKFSMESYETKMKRLGDSKKKFTIGYMTGCFDLFHIGHLNIIRRAKEQCDYLVIGLHKDASHKGKILAIPYEERREILLSLKYVDAVIMSSKDDTDPYFSGAVKFDKLFVGDDYKGSEKFNRYEEWLKDEPVEIVYLPYTRTTSSTMIRNFISK